MPAIKKERPLGILGIAIYYALFAFIYLLVTILSFTSLERFADFKQQLGIAAGFVSIIYLAAALVYGAIAIGLSRGYQWARIIAVIISALGILTILLLLFKGAAGAIDLVYALADMFIIGYLLFHVKAQRFFRRR